MLHGSKRRVIDTVTDDTAAMSNSSAAHPIPPVTALDALLTLEAAVAERLDRAREEGASEIARATSDAAEYTRQADEALACELAALDARQESALVAIDQEVSKAADATIAYYRGLADVEIARLADTVISEVSGLSVRTETAGSAS